MSNNKDESIGSNGSGGNDGEDKYPEHWVLLMPPWWEKNCPPFEHPMHDRFLELSGQYPTAVANFGDAGGWSPTTKLAFDSLSPWRGKFQSLMKIQREATWIAQVMCTEGPDAVAGAPL